MDKKILIIRKKQINALKTEMQRVFEKKAAIQMSELFPDICKVIGSDGVKIKIKNSINCAKRYSIVNEKDFLRYISLTFILGDKFDTDTDYQEIQNILNDTKIKDPSGKLDRIFKFIELSN